MYADSHTVNFFGRFIGMLQVAIKAAIYIAKKTKFLAKELLLKVVSTSILQRKL